MSNALKTRRQHKPQMHTSSIHAICVLAFATLFSGMLGCNTTHTTTTITIAQTSSQYPPRPTTPPPPFKLFHQSDNGTFTLVTDPNATDAQIEAIVWQLHDAAHARIFDELGIPQKVIDARDPMVWFHIYRGPKCAPEKYADGPPPCGASYHAAGDYTFGGGANHQWDDGALIHDEDHEVELWNPNAK